jgi:hypothetical protein
MGAEDNDLVQVPQDLTLINDEELAAFTAQVQTEVQRLQELEGDITADTVEYAIRLGSDHDRLVAEKNARDVRAKNSAQADQQRFSKQLELVGRNVLGAKDDDGGSGGGADGTGATVDVGAVAEAAARGATAALVAAFGERTTGADLQERVKRAASLADTRRHAPAVRPPAGPAATQVVTASVDIPGIATGATLNFDQVVDAFQKRARSLPVGSSGNVDGGPTVVTLRNSFDHVVDDRSSPSQVQELIDHVTRPELADALVAGGGWCAPSEIRYDFFNIACTDGMVDLPTFGVSRGGIRYPVSPSLADANLGGVTATFANTTNPWLWTETDDALTVTGSTNKPCVRVPCPTFDERRLECYGICLTAGNLTDDAYPEATANYLRLLLAAHQHAMNGRIIATMVSLSSAAVTGGGYAEGLTSQFHAAYNQILGGAALAAVDYRYRYGMCDTDVLEVVLPGWVRDVLRADLAWRQGVDLLSVTDAQINSYFSDRNLRPQWVGDWQVRATGLPGASTALTDWPTAATIMVYAAGTFLLGNGLTLDLGVVRDSTLNAENDHTAAWSEECHLVAKVGHESRQYTITWAINGAPTLGTALAHQM